MKLSHRKSFLSATLAGVALAAVTVAAAAPAAANEMLTVRDFVLTNGISDREPMGNVDSYAADDGKAVVFARIANPGNATTVNFVWYLNGEARASVPMNVGSSSGWRTWSTSNIGPGDWRVDLVDSNGTTLMSKAFTVRGDSNMSAEATSAVSSMPEGQAMHYPMDDGSTSTSSIVPSTSMQGNN